MKEVKTIDMYENYQKVMTHIDVTTQIVKTYSETQVEFEVGFIFNGFQELIYQVITYVRTYQQE